MKITTQAMGATSWRRGDVKYKKNEAFVDVVEIVNLNMSAKGTTFLISPKNEIFNFLLQVPCSAQTLTGISKCVHISLELQNANSV